MFEVLKNRLENARYTLEDAQKRIDWGVGNGKLTTEQADELIAIAQSHADATAVTVDVEEIAARQDALEGAILELAEIISGLMEVDAPDNNATVDTANNENSDAGANENQIVEGGATDGEIVSEAN